MEKTPLHPRVCSHRHSFALNNPLRRLLQSPSRIVGPYIKPGDTVIDIGCGPGFFSLPMAEMVGPQGKVIAVDLQSEMLDQVSKRLSNTTAEFPLLLHQCTEDSLGLDPKVQADFILAYYLVHETPDQRGFFRGVKTHLKTDGRLLVVEPSFHVGKNDFEETVHSAEKAGLTVLDRPKKKGGMSVLLSGGQTAGP